MGETRGLREQLAAIEHERWAHWQRYLHGRCVPNRDGSLTIPVLLVKHWERQIATPYDALSEAEKDADRQEVNQARPASLRRFTRFCILDFDTPAAAARRSKPQPSVARVSSTASSTSAEASATCR